DAHAVSFGEKRREKRQADDMVEVAMREEDVDVADFLILDQRIAERAEPGAGVEDEDVLAAADFDARRVAAIADCLRSRAGDASAHAPEPNPHRRVLHDLLLTTPVRALNEYAAKIARGFQEEFKRIHSPLRGEAIGPRRQSVI